jgi:hypothetical protein
LHERAKSPLETQYQSFSTNNDKHDKLVVKPFVENGHNDELDLLLVENDSDDSDGERC